MNKFYLLNDGTQKGALYLSYDGPTITYRFLLNEEDPIAPLYFKKNIGRKLYDFAFGGIYFKLFNNIFFDELRRNGITGFKSVPAIILLNKMEYHNYSCLVVNGRVSVLNDRQGEVIDRGPVVKGGSHHIIKKGIYFDESAWDGSDFFMFNKSGYIFITEKVKKIIEELKLTNIEIIAIHDYEASIENLSTGDPDLLAFYKSQLNK